MTREELRGHCKRQIQQFERVEKIMPVTPNDWKRYEEHKLVLELLEKELVLDKVKEVVCKWKNDNFTDGYAWDCMKKIADIVDKAESEVEE